MLGVLYHINNIHAHTHACTHRHACTHACTHTYMHTLTHAHTQACMHTCIQACMLPLHACTQACTQACMLPHKQAHKHAHRHIDMWVHSWRFRVSRHSLAGMLMTQSELAKCNITCLFVVPMTAVFIDVGVVINNCCLMSYDYIKTCSKQPFSRGNTGGF